MTYPLIIQATCALDLVVYPWFVSADGFLNTLAFRALPMMLGVLLAFLTFGQFMGWPV